MTVPTSDTGTESITFHSDPAKVRTGDRSSTATQSSAHEGDRGRQRARRLAGRRVLKVVGVTLICVSIALLGYAAYQIWGTGFIADRHQERLAAAFAERQERAAAGLPDVPAESPPLTAAAAPLPLLDNPVIQPDEITPTTAPAPTTTIAPVPGLLHEVAPALGGVVGRIVIESLELDWMVVEGVGAAELAQGPGHMPHTPVPGQPGNAVISGHRTTNGAPFYHLDQLVAGDTILVDTLVGTHTYEVVGTTIVEPTGVWVTQQWEGSWLTLTTCNPLFSSRERLIVFAKLVDGPNEAAIHDGVPPAYELPQPPQT